MPVSTGHGNLGVPNISRSIPIKLLLDTFMNIYNFAGEIKIFWAFVDHFASTMAIFLIFLGVKPPFLIDFHPNCWFNSNFCWSNPYSCWSIQHFRPEKQPENPRRLNSAPQKRGTKSSSDLVPLLQDAARGAG